MDQSNSEYLILPWLHIRISAKRWKLYIVADYIIGIQKYQARNFLYWSISILTFQILTCSEFKLS